MEEFIISIDFVIFDTDRAPNDEYYISIILRRSFLATSNALINCRNNMMKLSFDNMTLDLNIFNLQTQPASFDDVDHSNFSSVDNFSYDELEFEQIDEFNIQYESFFMDNEPKYDVDNFDDVCSVDFITNVACASNTSTILLSLKLLSNSLKYAFLGLNKSSPMNIAFDWTKTKKKIT